MIVAIFIILFLYLTIFIILAIGYHQASLKKAKTSSPEHHFSVIIPFRNEAENLLELLKSLSLIKYPKEFFEVIFIDDESIDNSEEIIRNFRLNFDFKILKNERKTNSPKKDAVLVGINNSKYDWIVTTDADCVVPKMWLNTINDYIISFNPEMLAGPVFYKNDERNTSFFQILDNLSLQFVTRGTMGLKLPIMANGANFIYRKKTFFKLNGFEGNQDIASGDDVFLLEKFRKENPQSIVFINSYEAIVETKPVKSWTEIINQRVRWASKTKHQKNPFAMFTGIIVTATNFLVPICFLAIVLSASNKLFFGMFLIVKVLSDLMVVFTTSRFYSFKLNLFKFIPYNFLYSIIFIFIFFRSIKGTYNWKSRNFA